MCFATSGVVDGDVLVLTKPLGTGIVTTALKRRKASPASVRAAMASMVALNKQASQIARRFPVHACSDVTGFGLLGHATEMAMGSGVTLMLDSSAMPLLPGARRLGEAGLLTGGCQRNRAYLADKVVVQPVGACGSDRGGVRSTDVGRTADRLAGEGRRTTDQQTARAGYWRSNDRRPRLSAAGRLGLSRLTRSGLTAGARRRRSSRRRLFGWTDGSRVIRDTQGAAASARRPGGAGTVGRSRTSGAVAASRSPAPSPD